MDKHFPYVINHINLSAQLLFPPEIRTEGQGNYLVFWWKTIALGHVFLQPNIPLSPIDYREKLVGAIIKAITHYHPTKTIPPWESWVLQKNEKKWELWMREIFSNITCKPVPKFVPVSTIICTRNRPNELKRCLQRIKALDCGPEEIIVVDNASDDEVTSDVVRGFEGVKYVSELKIGLDRARNTGILQSTLPYVFFLDDDVVIHPSCIFEIWDAFNSSSVHAMTGLVIAYGLQSEAQLIFETHWSFNRGYSGIYYTKSFLASDYLKAPPVWEIGAGANMAFKKEIFDEVGLFDIRLDVGAAGCSGDSEMWYRILNKGYTIYYNPRAVVFHEHRRELTQLKKQLFYYMRGHAVAALIQNSQATDEIFKKHVWVDMPKYYWGLVKVAFPRFRGRYQTLQHEIGGFISGIFFYLRNKRIKPS